MQTTQQSSVAVATTPRKHVCMGLCRKCGHGRAGAKCPTDRQAEKQSSAGADRRWPVISLGIY